MKAGMGWDDEPLRAKSRREDWKNVRSRTELEDQECFLFWGQ